MKHQVAIILCRINFNDTSPMLFAATHKFRSPVVFQFTPGEVQLNMGLPLNQIKFQNPILHKEVHKAIDQAQRGAGVPRAQSVADALRLQVELSFKQAGLLDSRGKLTAKALVKKKLILEGIRLENQVLIKELTKNGQNIKDWGKYTTNSITLGNGQNKQIHYYFNEVTQEVNYTHIDFKVKDYVKIFDNTRTIKDTIVKKP